MKYDALFVIERFSLPTEPAELQEYLKGLEGRVLDGFIFDDTKLDGNHPFPQCHYIFTSNLQEVISEDDKHYLVTRNTTYLLIGCAGGHNAANRVYTAYKDTLRGPVSLTGDPVV